MTHAPAARYVNADEVRSGCAVLSVAPAEWRYHVFSLVALVNPETRIARQNGRSDSPAVKTLNYFVILHVGLSGGVRRNIQVFDNVRSPRVQFNTWKTDGLP